MHNTHPLHTIRGQHRRHSLGALCVATVLSLGSAATRADPSLPISYSMPNGYGQANGGTFNYWDRAYSGAGNSALDYALLTGGLGELRDGIIATENWQAVERDDGLGPYVGWRDIDPLISFSFDNLREFGKVTVWHDDSNGNGTVMPPAGFTVSVGAKSQYFAVADEASGQPYASVLTLGAGFIGDNLQLLVHRRETSAFLSEIGIDSLAYVAPPPAPPSPSPSPTPPPWNGLDPLAPVAAVPEPASMLTLACGLLGLGLLKRRRAMAARR